MLLVVVLYASSLVTAENRNVKYQLIGMSGDLLKEFELEITSEEKAEIEVKRIANGLCPDDVVATLLTAVGRLASGADIMKGGVFTVVKSKKIVRFENKEIILPIRTSALKNSTFA